jgi:hypothetical protein
MINERFRPIQGKLVFRVRNIAYSISGFQHRLYSDTHKSILFHIIVIY